MRKRPMLLALVLLAGFGVPAAAEATTYYVSTAGNDVNSCAQALSESAAKRTIAGGLACLTSGDTLLIRGGIYTESIINNVPSGSSWSNTVRIAAYANETVWLKPTSGNFVIYFSENQQYIEFQSINLDGTSISNAAVFLDERSGGNPNHIRIQNAEVHHREGAGSDAGNAAITVGGSDNEFINLNVHGTGGPLGFYISGNRNLVDGCDVHDVYSNGIQIFKLDGTNASGNTVRNTRIHDIHDAYFFSTRDHRIRGMVIAGTGNVIYNNLIYNIGFTDPGWSSWDNSAGMYVIGRDAKLWNNTITRNTTIHGVMLDGASNAELKNNISYGNLGTTDTRPVAQYIDTGGGTGNVTSSNLFDVDPLFINAGAGNFGLSANSPAIDRAASLAAVATDMIGVPRPQGAAPDVGAYEYRSQQASAAPAPPRNVRIIGN
jgi:hypothetical protein